MSESWMAWDMPILTRAWAWPAGPDAANSGIPGILTGDPGAAIAYLHCPRDSARDSRDIGLATGAIASIDRSIDLQLRLIGLIKRDTVSRFLLVIIAVLMIVLLPRRIRALSGHSLLIKKRQHCAARAVDRGGAGHYGLTILPDMILKRITLDSSRGDGELDSSRIF